MWSRRTKKCFKVRNMAKQLKAQKEANTIIRDTGAYWLTGEAYDIKAQ